MMVIFWFYFKIYSSSIAVVGAGTIARVAVGVAAVVVAQAVAGDILLSSVFFMQ